MTGLERVRAWADFARRGDVGAPRRAVGEILARANEAGPEKGRLEFSRLAALLQGLARARAQAFEDSIQANFIRGGEAGSFMSSSERSVIALAVVTGSLVTLGIRRPTPQSRGFIVEWFAPCHAWPGGQNVGGVGSWGRTKSGDLLKPLRGRLARWAEREADDRVQFDWMTARALAFDIWAEPFDAAPGGGAKVMGVQASGEAGQP